MKPTPNKPVFLSAFVAISLGCILLAGTVSALTDTVPNAVDSRKQKDDETRAVAALEKSGIPLQRDPRGHVRWIEATEHEFTDEALGWLPRLPHLEWLEIGGGKVTPSSMAHLKDCPSLRRLYMHDINLSGDELTWLSSLSRLEALSLQRTGIDGKCLKNISAADTLTVLNLSGNKIANDDMDQIARLKGLEVLALADTGITSTGIAKLEGMARLNELNLMNCLLLDSDLEYFLSMPNLRIVYAKGCDISDMAIASVVARFPMLAIFR